MKLLRVIVLLCICVFLVALPLAAESKTTSGTVKSADGVAISYEMMGTGSPTLVFIHGWSCDRTYWREQTAYFAKKYKVVAVDLGGHGQSGLNRDNWTMQAFAGDVSAVIEKLDLKKVILIGHSMGGPVIAETALLIPDRLVALIGVDTFNDVGLIATDKQVNFLMGPMKADFKKGCQFFCRTMFTPKSDRALIDKIANDMSSAPPKIALSAMEELFKNDTPATIKKIKVPCRCINADKFPFNVEAARKHFVSFDIKIMKGVGHFLMMEAPKSFNKLLHDTISELISR